LISIVYVVILLVLIERGDDALHFDMFFCVVLLSFCGSICCAKMRIVTL